MSRTRAVLQLVRLPNVLTAAADSLAGWLIAGGSLGDVSRWAPLAVASMALYAAGMALNDWFDLEVDRVERPRRPLPSGAVPVKLAGAIGWGGLAVGLALAGLAQGGASPAFLTALALASAIVGYNAGLKHTFLGPWAMGACRAFNMLLGMAAATPLGVPIGWPAATAFGVFVAGVTWISRSEAYGGQKRNLVVGAGLQGLALVGLGVFALAAAASHGGDGDRVLHALIGVGVLAMVAGVVGPAAMWAVRDPSPATIQKAVKTGVLSLVWLDVALVTATRGPLPALAVAALWPPAFLLARRLYAT